jgi:prolyl-tRNA synthetase
MLALYAEFAESYAAVPVIQGEKTERERFAGAEMTLTIEAMMRDTRALQSATSHYLGTNFAEAFDITFNDVDNNQAFVHTTSWGLSTRMIGAIIMTHGDDSGLILPPRLAPHQLVIVPIFRRNDDEIKKRVLTEVERLAEGLKESGVRVHVDMREGISPGWKFNEWEEKGVPLRLEIGPKDLQKNTALLVDRLSGEKREVPFGALYEEIPVELNRFHEALYQRALHFQKEHTFEVNTFDEFKEHIEHGWVIATHCGDPESERAIQEETRATVRCIPIDGPTAEGTVCIHTGRPSGYSRKVIFARAY